MVSGPVPLSWMGAEVAFPLERSVVDLFRGQVARHPQSIAVKHGARQLTYQELDRQSDILAAELSRRGVGLEEPVVILLTASAPFIVALLGILKAGASYLPVELDTPAKRLEYLLSDSRTRMVVSDAQGRERLAQWSGVVLEIASFMDAPSPSSASGTTQVSPNPAHRAYLIYTSGSTGQPKGVEIEHHALTNLVSCYLRRFQITERDRSSMLAYVGFDVSVADIWPILCAGGTLVIPPENILLDPDGLIQWLHAEAITLTFVPTGLAEILFTRPWPKEMALRIFITGGDRLRGRPPKGLGFPVVNGYGPTESTVFATFSVVEPEGLRGEAPPIGRALDNVKTYVLDEKLRLLPAGEPGELYLGGEQVARGYFGRPELTAERFVVDPFSQQADARMYRTGDWARWLPEGELEFLGRRDGQIQIRGSRVELGEIEAMIFSLGGASQVCCVPRMAEGMPTGVVAHVVPATGEKNLAQRLSAELKERLPAYMVPAEFVLHERLPLTPEGKANRAAMVAMQQETAPEPVVPPRENHNVDQALAVLWHSLLPAAREAGPEMTFAQLGGDSLQAIKLLLGVEEVTGQKLELSSFLLDPTLAGLVRTVKARLGQSGFEPILVIRKQGTRPTLFCLHGHSGDVDMYLSLAEALGPDQPVVGIRSPGLENMNRLPRSIEEAAAEVIKCIRQVQPEGAPALLGYSWAGLLAFEVARQIKLATGEAGFTGLIGIDAPVPTAGRMTRLVHFARYFPSYFWHRVVQGGENRWKRLGHWGNRLRLTKSFVVEGNLPVRESAPSPISQHFFELRMNYVPTGKADLELHLFREQDSFSPLVHPVHAWHTDNLQDAGWNHWTARPNPVHWVPGNHYTIIQEPFVRELAKSVRQAMDSSISKSPVVL